MLLTYDSASLVLQPTVLTYDSASLHLQPTVLLENTFTVDNFTQSINVTLERVPYNDVKGNGSITGFTYEEISAGVQTPIMCAVRLVDSNDNSVVYREVYSSLDDGSYAFTGIRDRTVFGQTYDIIAKPTTANYFKKIIEGINPTDDLVQFKLLGVDSVSHVYQNQVSSITFKYESDSVLTDLQVLCNRPVEVDPYSKTITIMYSSNIVGNTLQDITFISNSLGFVRSYQLPFNVIETKCGYYLFDGNTNNEYGSDTLTVNGTPQYRDNSFIFNGSTKLQSNTSRFLTPNTGGQFTISFKFCYYMVDSSVNVNPLFSTTETARGGGSLYVFLDTYNAGVAVNNRGRVRMSWSSGGNMSENQSQPVINVLTENTLTLIYSGFGILALYVNGYIIYSSTSQFFMLNDGFVLGGSNVTSGFGTHSSINGYISDFEYTKGSITSYNSIENRPYYADFPNFTLYGGSLVDDKKRLWQTAYGLTVSLDETNGNTVFDNKTGEIELPISHGEMDFGTGDFTVELSFSNGEFPSTLLDFGSYENSGGLQFEFNDTALLIKQSSAVQHTITGNFVGEPYTRYTLTFSRTGTTFSFYIDGVLIAVIPNFTLNIVDSTKITFIRGTDMLHYYRVIKGMGINTVTNVRSDITDWQFESGNSILWESKDNMELETR